MVWRALCRCSYTNWTTSAHGCDDFFTDRQAIDMYKAHTSKVLNRVNTVTGIPYNQDSTIFGKALGQLALYHKHACFHR